MVKARRAAMEKMDIPMICEEEGYYDKLDSQTMSFTCAIDTCYTHIHIHWAGLVGEKISWYMAVNGRHHMMMRRV
jgi:hypothetical protein